MKKFLTNVLLFSLLLLLLLVVGLVMPSTPRSSKSLLYGQIKKDSLLINTNSPRIIFVGGSNLSFGINSALIKDSFGLNPINTAIHGELGLEYMMNNTIRYIKESDIVVLVPEYSHFYGRFIYGSEVLLRIVADIDFVKLLDLKKEQLKNVSEYFIEYSFSKFNITEYFGFNESEHYSVNSFNIYGDVYTHWSEKQSKFSPYEEITRKYNPNAITLINNFRIALEQKGALLLISYPCFQASSYDNSIKQINKVENELMNNKFILLGTPQRYRMADSLLFNTPYHLLKNGVDYRTELLIEDIKKVQTENIQYKKLNI